MSNNPNDITRLLTEKFFDGTISPDESAELLSIARKAAESDAVSDPDLCRDLRMILALHSPEAFAGCMETPEGLEARLDSHISGLARRSRKSLFARWSAVAGAAAAVAAIATIGFSVSRPADSDAYAKADSSVLLPDLTLAVADTRPAPQETAMASETGLPANTIRSSDIKPKTASAKPVAKRKTTRTTNPAQTPAIYSHEMTIATSAIALVPESMSAIAEINPMMASALVDPEDILAQPISTLSQTIDIVCESYATVIKAFNEANSTFETAKDRLSLVSAPMPPREI